MNKSGYPVLPKALQRILKALLPYCPRIALQGKNPYDHLEAHKEYLRHAWNQVMTEESSKGIKGADKYSDVLQSPLQPLMINLGASLYEFFEADTAKYAQYHTALLKAFAGFIQKGVKEVKILVVGAGRGPLIKCAFQAGLESKIDVAVTAIEKNPNTISTLLNCGYSKLHVVSADIRKWETDDTFDIILSELLGSFGDNELAPECLDGAQRFLKLPHGIYLPNRYSSYLQPINSEKLWNSAKTSTGESPLEVPYVVKIHSASFLGTPQKVFEFCHPREFTKSSNSEGNNSRYSELCFVNNTGIPTLMHGFAGYFEGILYEDIKTSIVPGDATPGINSWFPIYFPITVPFLVEPADKITIKIWRCENLTHVWYEWNVSVCDNTGKMRGVSIIHNIKGKAYSMGLH